MAWRILLQLLAIISLVSGHGRVLQPVSRASAWRAGFPTKPDYDDDGVNCGGFSHQWSSNHGRCGICGDAYDWPTPRPHELGGIYGQGIIVANYLPGSILETTVELTTSHRGFWEFRLCPDPQENEQPCFDNYLLELVEGGTKYYPEGSKKYTVSYRLPEGLVCEHCVIQWRYTAGNNWGVCKNGTQGLGCGNQEQFGACSDVSIGLSRSYDIVETVTEEYEDIPYPLFFYLRHGFFDAEKGLRNLLRQRPTSTPKPSSFSHRQPSSSVPLTHKPRPSASLKNKPHTSVSLSYKTKPESSIALIHKKQGSHSRKKPSSGKKQQSALPLSRRKPKSSVSLPRKRPRKKRRRGRKHRKKVSPRKIKKMLFW